MSRGPKQDRPRTIPTDVAKAAPTEADVGGAIERLVAAATPQIQAQLDLVLQMTKTKPEDLAVLVLDGSSPLAHLAPPEIRAGGPSVVAARLTHRSDLARGVASRYPDLGASLATPAACGHVHCFVTTAVGGSVQCATCELGMVPGGGPAAS